MHGALTPRITGGSPIFVRALFAASSAQPQCGWDRRLVKMSEGYGPRGTFDHEHAAAEPCRIASCIDWTPSTGSLASMGGWGGQTWKILSLDLPMLLSTASRPLTPLPPTTPILHGWIWQWPTVQRGAGRGGGGVICRCRMFQQHAPPYHVHLPAR